jgi:hypothetical protein
VTRIASRPPALPPQPQSPAPGRLLGEGQLTGSATAAAAVSASPAAVSAANGTAGTEPSAFARMVGSLGQETTRGEAAMKTALSAHGSDLGAADLLALQAGVYRYGEVVDLASRLVDRATSDVKTVLQGSGG